MLLRSVDSLSYKQTKMAGNFESLRPNRELLNPKFDGYKLSSDQLAVQSASLPHAVNIVRLKDDVFSFLHVKAFGWTNHLVLDAWSQNGGKILLYFVDESYAVHQIVVQDGKVQEFCKVFEIPAAEEKIEHCLNAFISFPSSVHAVVSDGAGQLYVIHTGNRLEKHDWKVARIHSVGKPFSILHSNFESASKSLGTLLLSVTPDEDKESLHVKHTVLLIAVVFSGESGESGDMKFGFEVQKEFQGHSVPLYGALESNNQAILVASEKPFSLVGQKNDGAIQSFDEISSATPADDNQSKSKKDYMWTQENDKVTIVFPLHAEAKEKDLSYEINKRRIRVGLSDGETFLKGDLFGDVIMTSCEVEWKSNETQWLEITLVKRDGNEQWTEVVMGDQRGIYRADGKDLLEIINSKMGDQASMELFNQGELEECDSIPEDVLYIVRMEMKDGNITQKTSLSTHQWLFTKTITPSNPPSFCIRHDVDALIWQPTDEGDGRVAWNHIGTLDAFGFVHASKKEQKFTSCSPDMSYAVICDVRNHVFTYHRHSVEDAVHAKQKLLQLDNVGSEGIVGVQACEKVIFVLAKEKLFIVSSF